jgi:hypothetical protein
MGSYDTAKLIKNGHYETNIRDRIDWRTVSWSLNR